MLRGVIYRLIEPLASMGHSSILKLICAICVCNTLTVGVHLSSTPSISGPGSATGRASRSYMVDTVSSDCKDNSKKFLAYVKSKGQEFT